jgi:hypothetical protein
MKSMHCFGEKKCRWPWFSLAVAAAALLFSGPASLRAQVVPAGDAGGLNLTAGGAISGFAVQYGDRKMLGVTAFVDADTRRRIGFEAEGRFLEFHQTANVHEETYSVGPRYHLTFGRFQTYAKGLVGFGIFHYPYGYGTDSDLVLSPGVGVEYRLSRRVRWRVGEFEYQYWPQFHYGALSTYGISTGLRIRIN